MAEDETTVQQDPPARGTGVRPGSGSGPVPLPGYVPYGRVDPRSYFEICRRRGFDLVASHWQTAALFGGLPALVMIGGLLAGGALVWVPAGLFLGTALAAAFAPANWWVERRRWQRTPGAMVLVYRPFAVIRRTGTAREVIAFVAKKILVSLGQIVLIGVPGVLGALWFALLAPAGAVMLGSFLLAYGLLVCGHAAWVWARLDRQAGTRSFLARPLEAPGRQRRRRLRSSRTAILGDEPDLACVRLAVAGPEHQGSMTVDDLPVELRQVLLHLTGRFDAAAEIGRVHHETEPDASTAYRTACSFAAGGRSDEAIQWLEHAVAHGWPTTRRLHKDLPGLRGHPALAAMTLKARENAKRQRHPDGY